MVCLIPDFLNLLRKNQVQKPEALLLDQLALDFDEFQQTMQEQIKDGPSEPNLSKVSTLSNGIATELESSQLMFQRFVFTEHLILL